MIATAILVVLIAIAGPDFRNTIIATRVKNASFDVFSSLTHARSEAITRNTTVRICKGTTWASGWTVTFAADCDPGSITPENTIRKQDAYEGITITNAAASVCFNGMGRLSTVSPCAATSFSIDAPGASEKNKRCVIIDASGRPTTKEGACS
jgi:type IV fimbrial biogenesis protein FimT